MIDKILTCVNYENLVYYFCQNNKRKLNDWANPRNGAQVCSFLISYWCFNIPSTEKGANKKS